MDVKQLIAKRAALLEKAATLAKMEAQTDETRSQFDALIAEADGLAGDIKRAEALAVAMAAAPVAPTGERRSSAPAFNRTPLGEHEMSAALHYIRTGRENSELRASNDTDMNVTTTADGGFAVPTGHYNGIIAKRSETMISDKVGVLRIPGKGTTVNVPTDNGTANEFVSTAEAAAYDRDAPVLARPAMTLVKYTKKVELQQELLEDEDSAILAFLDNYIGRGLAQTHNKLLLTEVLAAGTAVTLANAAAVAAADVTKIAYTLKGEYADSAAWIMKRSTEGLFRGLQGNAFSFAPTPGGSGRDMWGFPVYNSEYAGSVVTTGKSIVFGNFAFVGLREAPALTFLRDPYGGANTGTVRLYYYTRVVYKTLQAEAIMIGTHP